MKHTITLEIAGTRFRLVADAQAEHLHALAEIVNGRVAELATGSRTASSAQLLAMVALGMADDLKTAQDKLQQMESLTRGAIQKAIDRIDARLEAQGPS
ncbi:MAG: cell division protein ZapA [Myxococcales bacterium]|nr:cell division protein ZapA [Myxococcales bacterium]MDD9964708.1 cell division protein ZapA [Myxococcales bacterium]